MRPIIFQTESEFQSFLQSFDDDLLPQGSSKEAREIIDNLSLNAKYAFELKDLLAKNKGGLGNRKSVRRMAREFTEIQSNELEPAFISAINEYSQKLDELMGDESNIFKSLFKKASLLLSGHTTRSKKDQITNEAVQSIIALYHESVDRFTDQLKACSDKVLIHMNEDDAAEMKRALLGTQRFANLQKDLIILQIKSCL